MIKKLLKHVKQYKKQAILTPIFGALEVLMETLIPFVTAYLIDEGVSVGNTENIFKYGAIMLGFAFLGLIFAILAGRFAATASTGFAANLRSALYAKIQSFSFANIDKFSTGSLITRLTTDVNSVQQAFQMTMRMAVRAPLTMLCSLVMCFIINKKISLVFLGAIIFLAVVLTFAIKHVIKLFTELFERFDNLNTDIQENVSAIRVVKAYVREDYEIKKFDKVSMLLYKCAVKAEGFMALTAPLMMFVVDALIILVSWIGAHFIISNIMTTGQLTSLFSYISSVLMSLLMLMAVFVMLGMSLAAAKRIVEVLDEEPSIKNPENPIMEVPSGEVVFDDVCFAYNADGSGEDTLKDINIKISSGETVGVIGGTGSGKSSFVNLISRLYDVKSGSVTVGGIDVREYDIESLRNNVSVVLQKNVLFSGSILDNLRWGKEDATYEECVEACKAACADEFIEQMPEKYETHIEQGGSNVSGGQKQRLCIARAILKNPKVLILDDSTSAVDTATEGKINESFADIIPEATKIIITQRAKSIMNADKIIVLDDGKIVASGSHDELLDSCDIYREIYEAQAMAGGDFDEAPRGKEVR